MPPFRIGIDVGGTFTDLVLLDEATGGVAPQPVVEGHKDASRI